MDIHGYFLTWGRLRNLVKLVTNPWDAFKKTRTPSDKSAHLSNGSSTLPPLEVNPNLVMCQLNTTHWRTKNNGTCAKKHLNPFKQMFRHKPFVKLEPQKRHYEISIFLRKLSCLHHFPKGKVAGLSIQCIKCIAFLFTSRKESIHLKLWDVVDSKTKSTKIGGFRLIIMNIII